MSSLGHNHHRFTRFREFGALCTVFVVMVLFTPVSHAGGLGFAILGVIAGIAGIAGFARPLKFSEISGTVIALLVFLAWVYITSFWSPYEDPQVLNNPAKLFIGVILYLGVFWIPAYRPLHWIFPLIAFIMVALLIYDQHSSSALSKLFYPLGENEHPIARENSIYQNLSHSITVLTLIAGPVIYHLWKYKAGKFLAILWIFLVLYSAYQGRLAVGIVAILAAIMFMGLAYAVKDKVIDILTFTAATSIIFAPLAGFSMNYVPQDLKDGMNDSWEHRIEMWGYVAEKISEKPILGHGFDAVRTFDRTYTGMQVNGKIWEQNIVALHPHNAGLHIWSETGAIGAALACIVLFMLRHSLKNAIQRKPELAIPMAGFLAAALTLCTITYGIWQEWFWGALILIGALIPMSIMNAK